MSDTPPWNPEAGEVSVTLKHDGKYEAPWMVFRGRPESVKADILAAFGWDTEAGEGKSLYEIALQADRQAKAEYAVQSQAGGRVISKERKRSSTSANVDTDAASSEQQTSDTSEAGNPLADQIAAINNVDDLKKLWAENQEAFQDGDLMDVWKARGKELSK